MSTEAANAQRFINGVMSLNELEGELLEALEAITDNVPKAAVPLDIKLQVRQAIGRAYGLK